MEPKVIAGNGPIVMVDDGDMDFFIARTCYERSRLGNELIRCASGQAFLAFLNNCLESGAPLPALVLLDINMPGMDGFDTLAAVRSREEFKEIPIISMLTNSDSARDRNQSLELGANAFFTKPMDLKDYIAFFDSLIDRLS
ncbi:MAG: response regulator [Candidatus Eisenbacteria bacterium]